MAAFNSPQIPVRVENTSGLVIPPNSCVAIGENANLTPGVFIRGGSGFGEGEFTVKVRRPDATAVGSGSPSQFMFTLDNPIPVGKQGYATPSIPVWAAVDSAITARAAKVGPVAGSFKLGAVEGFYHVRDLLTISSDKYALIETAAGGGTRLFGFKITTAMTSNSGVCSLYKLKDVTYTTAIATGVTIKSSGIFGNLALNILGQCALDEGDYIVTQAGCNPEEEYV
jgi:hypothetical protein